jgi:hypothetical protein
MTQETTPASDPRLDEWEKLAKDLANVKDTTLYPLITQHLVFAAREAIPTLIGMVRERDARILAIAQKFDKHHPAPALMSRIIMEGIENEARATAAEARVKELESQLSNAGWEIEYHRNR